MDKILSSTALDAPLHAFLAHQRALGRAYQNEEYVLRGLRNFLLSEHAAELDQRVFDHWCEQIRHLAANTRRSRQLIVRKLCLYRRRSEPSCFVPDALYFARPQPYRVPIVIEPRQVARMLAHANAVAPSANSPLRGPVLRLAVVLLYTTGLRRGELLRLRLSDVDAKGGVLQVRESKFHKSRLVPLSSSTHRELRRYLRARRAAGCDPRPNAPLLCNCSRGWRPYTGTGLSEGIRLLFEQAGVRDAQGHCPCIHDLRHSFAVQALIRLYRSGADVQTGLPQLALYMGHVSIVSTAYYLHFVPKLATLASARFARHCGHVLKDAVR
ncbi:MAG: tyrosine-type recombinase/integrase [Desulfuromonadales bacterium]|nr:tyrosine-type recombinase/integrase [Gammaproteobacteria bacterium]NIR34232.1 tyrosine-type recombinase/integrase [Desulfuromonadales bacterium]NIR82348.1 tyrosine-type recombinase/integrase [Gammaproteobacteria bacterium]NIU03501.1 tyrosine-type recombinase/integrase [Gammaproteobacteria bacterium]NIV50905.1 tyrosine-type recombinase/integrase [Gammaproteobacteria bacterium]